MPLDFDTTKVFRDRILAKTLQVPNGPQTFTAANYRYKSQNEFANVDPGAVDTNRTADLLVSQNANIFKPLKYNVVEELNVIPRRANLSLYYNGTPYFLAERHNLVGIISNSNYENESELFKFAASYIRDRNQKGPVYSRIQQNLYKATVGRVRLIDALQGNLSAAVGIVTGKVPLIESNYQITVAKSPIGKGIDFLQTVAGVEFPWVEIPGDYLSNPNNPINVRPVPNSEFGKIFQDTTGALGSLLGIQRRPTENRKPSDLFIEYMGNGQKQTLFDLLSYSKYAPNYTTTARSQNTSKLFNFIDKAAQGVKNALGVEAPAGVAYIGDDRGNDAKFAMYDFNGRPVRSPYYLSLLFDPIQAELFQKERNYTEGGQLSGKLTWISINSKNKLGANNTQYDSQRSQFEDSLSTKFDFRDDSLLGYTQDILDSMPTNGGEARSHVANVIDQTTRIFREGTMLMSKGSAIKYVDKFGEESGVEYCRTWTKDRPYISYSDTMKKGGNIRKFEGTVVSNPWNLNIAPMSNGKKDFGPSTNIFSGYDYGPDSDGKSFYAKKYMFSLENLAWKTSNRPGFTVLDLPFCERGPNGGRVMWFPPYDLKVSENNSAQWETNKFLGRPEPVYTYSSTERTGQISFKVVVDHPSILNLLVREEFKNMPDEEADNYINAVFAGCKDLDFYELIRKYTTLDASDVQNIQSYLNKGGDPITVQKYKAVVEEVTTSSPEATTPNASDSPNSTVEKLNTITLHFDNDVPGTKTDIKTSSSYNELYDSYYNKKSVYNSKLTTILTSYNSISLNDELANNDRKIIYGATKTGTTIVTDQVTKLDSYFETLKTSYESFTGKTQTLRTNIESGKVKNIFINIFASTSASGAVDYNKRLSMRRSYSIMKDFLIKISKDNKEPSTIKWFESTTEINNQQGTISKDFKYTLKELGWEWDGEVVINIKNYGESWLSTTITNDNDCFNKDFKKNKELNTYAPISFFCRKASVDFYYDLESTQQKPNNPEQPKVVPKSRIEPNGQVTIPSKVKKPPIDVMKRIIMKTLSECYYFKILEQDSPMVFSSLREKLRYFHPGFHSMTPEGLNSRLTFLQQCIRPGDTIPIKGLSDDTDINARNTSFGPPPICVLRIGDFYHSKVIIRDVNFSYEDSPWDMNPEGIGMQPMIASVTLSVSFIGGHGLEEPVSQLQNALSSNFYANTEIYDERAKSTNKRIDGMDANKFTKDFLEKFPLSNNKTPEPSNEDSGNVLSEGQYVGILGDNKLDYTSKVNDVFSATKNYFTQYKELYNNINTTYGSILSSMALSPNYREIKSYQITKGDNSTIDIDIFGIYKKGNDFGALANKTKSIIAQQIETTDLCTMFGFSGVLSSQKIEKTNRILVPYVKKFVTDKLTEFSEIKQIKDFENTRNNLITTLDKVNFIVKYERDFKIFSGKTYEVELSGFTRNLLYKEYSYCIDYINAKNTTLYTDLDVTVNFKNPVITNENLSDILSVLLQKEKNNIINLFNVDKTIYDEKTQSKMSKRFDNFINIPRAKPFTFDKFKDRANGNKLEYGIATETETTNTAMIEEGKKLNSSVVNVTNKLNYYKTNI